MCIRDRAIADAVLAALKRGESDIESVQRVVRRSAGKFVNASEAWLMCREGKEDPDKFGIFDMHGLWFIRGNLVRELAALVEAEMLPWDVWGLMDVEDASMTAAQYDLLDAVARALVADPRLLILDEATSSVDLRAEQLIEDALRGLLDGRTAIIIAHRLATIRDVDCIYVLENGQIIEQGTHETLSMLEDGVYNALAKLQFEAVSER